MKNKGIRIFSAIVIGFSVFMAFGWSFFEMVVGCRTKKKQTNKKSVKFSHIKVNHPRDKFEKQYEEGKAWCLKQDMQDCYIMSVDGLRLHAFYLPAENAKRYVLLSHGYKGSGFGDFANMARFLHENGCNLLFIEQRCCGKSQGKYITFGAKEKFDVQRWAYFIANQNKKKLPIYLYGESMGAAAALMALGQRLPRDVRGVIADCGFCSMKEQIRYMAARWFHLNWIGLLLFRLDLFCGLSAGFRMKDADTAEAMKRNKKPVLFFHGSNDTYVNPGHSLYNYSMCRAPKEIVFVPEARHLCSAYANPGLYRKKVTDFFEKYDENTK